MRPNTVTSQPLIDVHARITRGLYDQMVAECGHCTCSLTGFIRTAIAREIVHRRQQRSQQASAAILAGQIDIEGTVHG